MNLDFLVDFLKPLPLAGIASVGCLASGLATGLGAIPILFTTHISQKAQDIMLGFGAGVMLAATSFSLIIPATEAAAVFTRDELLISLLVAGGIAIGGIFLWICDKYAPHEHFIKGKEGPGAPSLSRIWLFIIAITIHNFPEGLAVGVGFGGETLEKAIPLAIGIGLQNMPEGLVVALALIGERYSKWQALGFATLTGAVEPVMGLLGFLAVSLASSVLPWGLSFAAGAMLYVISHEIIPESHRKGFGTEATVGLMFGFIIMMVLDISLG